MGSGASRVRLMASKCNSPHGKDNHHSQSHWYMYVTRRKLLTIVLTISSIAIIVSLRNVFATKRHHTQTYPFHESKDRLPTDEVVHRREPSQDIRKRRYLPQCLIIGARKAGTRALIQMLNTHPLIASAGREPHFFDKDEDYAKGFEYYRRQMPLASPDQITIEKTPSYLRSEEAPERVFNMNSSMKLLVIVIDPVERAISDYTQIRVRYSDNDPEFGTFEKHVFDSDTQRIRNESGYLERSMYYSQLVNWLRYFPLHQFKFIDGHKLVHDPLQEIPSIEDFLGLPHSIDENNLVFNRTKGFYCFRQTSTTGQLSRLKCLNRKGRHHPSVDATVIHKLRQYFAPFNEQFYRLCNRRFDWPTT